MITDKLTGLFWALLVLALISMCSSCTPKAAPLHTANAASEAALSGVSAVGTLRSMDGIDTTAITVADTLRTFAIADTVYHIRTATRTLRRLLYIRDTIATHDTIRIVATDTIRAYYATPTTDSHAHGNLRGVAVGVTLAAIAAAIIAAITKRSS